MEPLPRPHLTTAVGSQQVSFRYRPRAPWVLRDFSWQSEHGVTVVLGPNGAGKSTLLALLASATRPATGTISLGELSLPATGANLRQWRRAVGWVPQQIDRISGLTCHEQVAYAGWLKGLTKREAHAAAPTALDKVDLVDKARERVTSLSGGQARRLGIACALVHESRVVLMDEPTAGLDPQQRDRLYAVIHSMPEVDWLISTHQTEDLENLARSVTVMAEGEVRFQGTSAEFLALGDGSHAARQAVQAYRSLVKAES